MTGKKRPTPTAQHETIRGLLTRLGRPTTAAEASSILYFHRDYVLRVMRDMADRGLLTCIPGRSRSPSVYALPDFAEATAEPLKTCSKCRCELPVTAFGIDRSSRSGRRPDCGRCRSLRPEKYHPSRPKVTQDA